MGKMQLQNGSTSKLSAHLIVQQQSKHLGVKLLVRNTRRRRLARLSFATKDISKVEEKFGRSAIEGHRTHPDRSEIKWKQIGVNEITNSRELPFLFNG